jgi:uncharacterized protein
MMLLDNFRLINTAFYQGDILTLYAFLGFLLIPITDNSRFITAVILMLQPEWARCIYYMLNPDYVDHLTYQLGIMKVLLLYENGSFLDYSRKLDVRKLFPCCGKWKIFSGSGIILIWMLLVENSF